MCLDLFRGGTQGKQRSSWIKPTGNSLSCSYRECIKFSAFRACVSQRSVSASSSALNCSQVSLLGAPIKPASRESVFAEAQKGNCVAFVCTILKGTCLYSELSHCPSLGGPGATASLCHCHGSALGSVELNSSTTLCCCSSASFPSAGMVQSSTH